MILPKLYRKRLIPNELIHLRDDIILEYEKERIITKWVTLHPRKDIARGLSAVYIDKGIKVSKIYDRNDKLVYWYCDIIQVKADATKNTVIIEDLLIDVILYEDGTMRIMDLDEFSEALDLGLISQSEATYALRTLDSLLNTIYSGRFPLLQQPINDVETSNL